MEPEQEAPSRIIVWLSVIHVLYLLSLPTLANFTIVPAIDDRHWHSVPWGIFGLIGVPIAFAGVSALNPFPRNIPAALMRTFFLPVATAVWWAYQDGALLEYFAVMLVFEFSAIFLSLFIMCFISLGSYDPHNPKAGSVQYQFIIILTHGCMGAGTLMTLLLLSIWPWIVADDYWWSPITAILLIIAALDYLWSNYQLQLTTSAYRWEGGRRTPNRFPDTDVSIEPVLLLAPVPWLISFYWIN